MFVYRVCDEHYSYEIRQENLRRSSAQLSVPLIIVSNTKLEKRRVFYNDDDFVLTYKKKDKFGIFSNK